MTGRSIKEIRDKLGMNVHAFAAVLGVHVSTIYRWEQHSGVVVTAPLQGALLDGLSRVASAQIGASATRALVKGGPLAGLRVLIDAATKES